MIAPESKLHSLLQKQSIAFLLIAMLVSLCLILIGYLKQTSYPLAANIIITFGSTGLGTCFGLVIGTVTGTSAVTRIKELIESTLDSSIHSDESVLADFRQVWHHYLLTEIDGDKVWRYRKLDFSQQNPRGKLLAFLNVRGPDAVAHQYVVEGYMVMPRLLIVQRAMKGGEMPLIHLYPFAGLRFRSIVAGSVYLQSWTGTQFQTISIMARMPMPLPGGEYQEGTLPPAMFPELRRLWDVEAKVTGLCPPKE